MGAPTSLAMPATQDALDQLASNIGHALPDDVTTLYRWHDGAEDFIPGSRFLSTVEAAAERARIQNDDPEMCTQVPVLRELLPVLQQDNNFFMVRCAGPLSGVIYEWSYWEMEPKATHASLLHLVQLTEQAYLSRAYYPEYDGWYVDYWRYCLIRNKFQPLKSARRNQSAREASAIALDQGQDSMTRSMAVMKMSYDLPSIHPLIALLGDNDAEVVRHAAFALGEMDAREALPELLMLLGRQPRVAADALAGILTPDDTHVVAMLSPLLEHADLQIRIAALNALRALRSPEAVPAVISRLDDPEAGLLWYAIKTLAHTRDKRALLPLQSLQERVDTLGLDPECRGGSRGSKPTPMYLRMVITEALEHIRGA